MDGDLCEGRRRPQHDVVLYFGRMTPVYPSCAHSHCHDGHTYISLWCDSNEPCDPGFTRGDDKIFSIVLIVKSKCNAESDVHKREGHQFQQQTNKC